MQKIGDSKSKQKVYLPRLLDLDLDAGLPLDLDRGLDLNLDSAPYSGDCAYLNILV